MTPISVRSVDELIAVLPHSLGHQPADALVVVVLSGRTPLFTARLPLHDEDGTLSCPREVGRQVGAIVAAALRNGGHAVHAVAFEEHRGDSDAAIEALEHHVREGGLELVDLTIVRDGRRWSPRSPDVRERVEGVSLRPHPDSPAVLLHVLRGSAPLPDRAAVRALVSEEPQRAPALCDELEHRVERWLAMAMSGGSRRVPRQGRLWGEVLDGRVDVEGLTTRQLAGLMLSLLDVDWRDALIAVAAPGSLPLGQLRPDTRRAVTRWLSRPSDDVADSGDARRRLEPLLALARRAPDAHPLTATVCAVAGCVAWHLGLGGLAKDAHERALRIDPDLRLARLGLQVIGLGINPAGRPAAGPSVARDTRRAV